MRKLVLILILLIAMNSAYYKASDSLLREISEMSLDEKIGTLFFIEPNNLLGEDRKCIEVNDELINAYNKYPCGGFILYANNIVNHEQLIDFTSDLKKLGMHSPLICIDEEGGSVARIANSDGFNVEKFPDMAYLAENGTEKVYEVADSIGSYLSEYHIDIDFAPVGDVNTNPNNPIIGKRAFSNDPFVVADMIEAYINGLHNNGIRACLKHYPGHGDTNNDSHLSWVGIDKTWQELLECELIPFKRGIDVGVDLIMLGHICVSSEDSLPASLSFKLVSERLRNELGYKGVIITDALSMGAISNEYSNEDAVVMAIKAGADIVLCPEDYVLAFERVKSEVENGEISIDRINESVYRILRLRNNNE